MWRPPKHIWRLRKEASRKEELVNREEESAVTSPPKGKLDPGCNQRIYFGKEWESLLLWAEREAGNWTSASLFFLTKSPNTQQFLSFGVNKRQSREMYFGFKNIGILQIFLRFPGKTQQDNWTWEFPGQQRPVSASIYFLETDVREVERNHKSRSPLSCWHGGSHDGQEQVARGVGLGRERPCLRATDTGWERVPTRSHLPNHRKWLQRDLCIPGEMLKRSCWFMGNLIRKVNQMQNYPNEVHTFQSWRVMIWGLPAVRDGVCCQLSPITADNCVSSVECLYI